MKKVISTIVFSFFPFGCENLKESPGMPESLPSEHSGNINSVLESQFLDAFNDTKNTPPFLVIERKNNSVHAKFQREELFVSSTRFLEENYYKDFKLNYTTSLYEGVKFYNASNTARINEEVTTSALINDTSFSDEQKLLLNSLVNEVSTVIEPSYASGLITAYNQKVINSKTLNDEQKIEMLVFSALSSSLVQFINEGGVSQIQNSISNELGVSSGPNARISGCKVNWRSVWGGAVVGFVGGLYVGGKAGLVAGTFTVPGVGTATGLVGGAMLGGASGFVTGAASTVAAELLLTCFRGNIQSVEAQCRQAWERYERGEITAAYVPSECIDDIIIEF